MMWMSKRARHMEISRPEMLWRWNFLQAGSEKRTTSSEQSTQPRLAVPPEVPETLFADESGSDAIGVALAGMPVVAYTQEQRLRYEREILEVCVSGHPLDFLPRNGEVWSDELDGLRGKRVTLCGWVVTYRHVGTKNYRNMMFVTLEDQRGLYEVVLFPDAYDRYGGLVFETRAMRVTGRVEIGRADQWGKNGSVEEKELTQRAQSAQRKTGRRKYANAELQRMLFLTRKPSMTAGPRPRVTRRNRRRGGRRGPARSGWGVTGARSSGFGSG